MEKTKRDSRHIDPLKDEEKFFQGLKFKSGRMNRERLSKDDHERLRQRIHVYLRSCDENGPQGGATFMVYPCA